MHVALRTLVPSTACLWLTACLVSFTDYPLGSLGGSDRGGASEGGSIAGESAAGGAPIGGAAAGGSSSDSDAGGSDAIRPDAEASDAGDSQAGSSGSPPPDLMIDDFEDGDSRVLANAGRNGSWFILNDMTGQQTPLGPAPPMPSLLMPARDASMRGMHTSGSGFTVWGALIGANFVVNGMTAAPYDISAYQGITFWAKLGKPTAAEAMRVSIRTFETVYGCTSCGDHFGSAVTLSDKFQSVQLPFAAMKQVGWGKPQEATFDTARAYAVIFGWTTNVAFDVWIDDVSFY